MKNELNQDVDAIALEKGLRTDVAFFNIFLASFCNLRDSSISVTTTSFPSTILVTTDAGVGPTF